MKRRFKADVSLFFALLFVFVTAFFILYNADFTFGDDCLFLETICRGKIFPWLSFQNNVGRFVWSLSEYNVLLLTPFNDCPWAFYTLSALQYLFFSLFSLLLVQSALRRCKANYRSTRIFLYGMWLILHLYTQSTFFCLVQPEKLQLALLSAFCYFLIKAEESNLRRHWGIAFILAVLVTYCKEPMFGCFLIIGFLTFFSCRSNMRARIFATGLIINSCLYVLLYYFIVFRNMHSAYDPGHLSDSKLTVLVTALKGTPHLLVLAAVCLFSLVKNIHTLFKGLRNHEDGFHLQIFMHDVLLFSSIAYCTAIILMGGTKHYYFYPCFIFAFPALLYYASEFLGWNRPFRIIAVIFCGLLCIHYAQYDIPTIVHRVKDGHRDMDELRLLAAIAAGDGKFYWYDEENFKSAEQSWRSAIFPRFINSINESNTFCVTKTSTLPNELHEKDYVISLYEILDYEGSAYSELPVKIFHVYHQNQ